MGIKGATKRSLATVSCDKDYEWHCLNVLTAVQVTRALDLRTKSEVRCAFVSQAHRQRGAVTTERPFRDEEIAAQ